MKIDLGGFLAFPFFTDGFHGQHRIFQLEFDVLLADTRDFEADNPLVGLLVYVQWQTPFASCQTHRGPLVEFRERALEETVQVGPGIIEE